MSRYEILLIRFGLIYLVLTGALGLFLMIRPEFGPFFRLTHAHLGFVGFFLSLVMGVAFWLLPRPGGIRQPGPTAAVFYLLNSGVILRSIAEPFWRAGGPDYTQWLSVTGGLLQLGAMTVFAVAMSRRVMTPEQIQKARQKARLGDGD